MLIYPRPSEFCYSCLPGIFCECKCHDLDLINSKHQVIRIEEMEIKVKPNKDLDHFR